jgi:hypothetical protein
LGCGTGRHLNREAVRYPSVLVSFREISSRGRLDIVSCSMHEVAMPMSLIRTTEIRSSSVGYIPHHHHRSHSRASGIACVNMTGSAVDLKQEELLGVDLCKQWYYAISMLLLCCKYGMAVVGLNQNLHHLSPFGACPVFSIPMKRDRMEHIQSLHCSTCGVRSSR